MTPGTERAMGKRGPRPTPTAILNLRGSWRGKRRGPEVTPPPPTNRRVPGWLRADPVASAEWRRVVPRLAAMGVLADLDRTSLAAYCQSWSDYRHALGEHDKIGRPMVYKTPDGLIKTNPMLVEVHRAYARFCAAAAEFGLTPVARVGMKANPDSGGGAPMDEFEIFKASRGNPNLRLAK